MNDMWVGERQPNFMAVSGDVYALVSLISEVNIPGTYSVDMQIITSCHSIAHGDDIIESLLQSRLLYATVEWLFLVVCEKCR